MVRRQVVVSVTVVESRKRQTLTLSGRFYTTLLAFICAKYEGQGSGDGKDKSNKDCDSRFMYVRDSFGDGIPCWC